MTDGVKCTRCKRSLKNIQYIGGAPYGPICVVKMGGATAKLAGTGRKKKAGPVEDPGQETLFSVDTLALEIRLAAATLDDVIYRGEIIGDDTDRIVTVTRPGGTYDLNPRYDLANHSPTGYCWGYGGSGPAQLALAILVDYLRDVERARALYQDFKFKVIAGFPMGEGFVLTGKEIESAITALDVARMKA